MEGSKRSLSWPGEMSLDERVIMEIGWAGDDALIIKEIDRAARKGNVVLIQGGAQGKIVRTLGKNGEEGDDGWIDHASVHS